MHKIVGQVHTYDTTNRSTCNFIITSFYTQELSLIRTNLAMTKFKQLVSLWEGTNSTILVAQHSGALENTFKISLS